MRRYQFTSKIQDLLDAEEADRTARTGLSKTLRWELSLLIVIFSVIGFLAFRSPGHGGVSIVGLLVDIVLLYYLVGKSYWRRRRIRKVNPPCAEVTLEFQDDHLEIEVGGSGTFGREWRELAEFTNAPRGILLYFDDGIVNWLPNRVFTDKMGKKAFVEFLQSQGDPKKSES